MEGGGSAWPRKRRKEKEKERKGGERKRKKKEKENKMGKMLYAWNILSHSYIFDHKILQLVPKFESRSNFLKYLIDYFRHLFLQNIQNFPKTPKNFKFSNGHLLKTFPNPILNFQDVTILPTF